MRSWKPLWLLVLLLAFAPAPGATDDPAAAFAEANRLYEQGKFTEAVRAYESLRSSGVESAALWFNLGNAWFKSGQTGRAIAAYREAARLAPRDPDIRANLRFARESVGARATDPAWQRWLHAFTLDEWAVMTAGALWLWLGLVAAGALRSNWRAALLPWRQLALTGLVLAGTLMAAAAVNEFTRPTAVVVTPEAVVRYGPLEESQSHYTLQDGAEVEVLDRNGDWLQVRDAQRRTGWVKARQVIVPGMAGRRIS